MWFWIFLVAIIVVYSVWKVGEKNYGMRFPLSPMMGIWLPTLGALILIALAMYYLMT